MYVDNLIIKDSDIEYAEKILLSNGLKFDKDRRDYIKNFNTIDLRAVPGSGKTTLLLAKLLILERKLPLKNNQAVLVLSHTNTAVNEIKSKIEMYCPKLFTYPNFIGTIQRFVNEFLAIPYFESKLHKKVISIDEDFYFKSIEDLFAYTNNYTLKKWLERKYDANQFLYNLRFDKSFNLISNINENFNDFELKDRNSRTYKGLKEIKMKILAKGILHYDDAYSLAFRYLCERPKIIDILNQRFKYVFVDEMQDMDTHQFKLLEMLFNTVDNVDGSIYQRLGDNNQAIYFSSCKGDNVWNLRETVITVNGSNRLTPLNASLVSKFSIDGITVNGLNKRYSNIKPILYVFQNDNCKCKVVQKFAEELEKIYGEGEPLTLKVVAWRKRSDSEEKKSLYSYCPRPSNINNGLKVDNLYEVHIERNYSKMYDIIIDYMVSTFNINGILLNNEKVTRSRLFQCFKDNESEYLDFKLYLYLWCTQLISNNVSVVDEINLFISRFCKNRGIDKPIFNSLRDNKNKNIIYNNLECNSCKVYNNLIDVCTVHSVKGETHDATLFLESFYNGKYESDILGDALNGKKVQEIIEDKTREIERLNAEINELANGRGTKTKQDKLLKIVKEIDKIKEYAKLVYVGLSRAQGVVAYGISSDKFEKYKTDSIHDIWDVREII